MSDFLKERLKAVKEEREAYKRLAVQAVGWLDHIYNDPGRSLICEAFLAQPEVKELLERSAAE